MIRIGVGMLLRERWRIDALVGEGGLATVWAATHERNGSRVAIKILRPDFVRDGFIKERFAREARLANRIKHPAVVRVIDDDTLPDGTPILVMDLLIGETLEDRRERANGVLPLNEVLGYMRTILEALEVAHAAGVVHRDLKPDNLFIEDDGRLRVLDFGIARVREGSEHATQSGTVLGTLDYMPPEQASGRSNEVDARSDLYSLAATVFKLLTGEPVHFTTNGITEMMVAAMTRPARSLAEAAPGLSPQLVRIIDRALRSDPRDRWPSAVEMKHALLASLGPRDSPRLLDLARDMSVDDQTLLRDEGVLDEEATYRLPDKHALLAKYGGKVPKPPPAPTPPRSTPSSTPAARRHTPVSTPAAMRPTPSSSPAARRHTPVSTPAASPRGLRANSPRDSDPVPIPPPPPRRTPASLPPPPVASGPQLADSYPGHSSDSYPGHSSGPYPGHSSDSYPGHSSGPYAGHSSDSYPGHSSGPYPGHSSDSYPGHSSGPYPGHSSDSYASAPLPAPAVRFIHDPPKKKGKALSIFLALVILLLTFTATVYFTQGEMPWHLINKWRP